MERLFHHYDSVPDAAAWAPFLIARVLEDGDSRDLVELFSEVGEERVRAWLAARGGRQLSRRSRLFWRTALGVEPSAPHPLGCEVWPL